MVVALRSEEVEALRITKHNDKPISFSELSTNIARRTHGVTESAAFLRL